jgi:hypothetical protein
MLIHYINQFMTTEYNPFSVISRKPSTLTPKTSRQAIDFTGARSRGIGFLNRDTRKFNTQITHQRIKTLTLKNFS